MTTWLSWLAACLFLSACSVSQPPVPSAAASSAPKTMSEGEQKIPMAHEFFLRARQQEMAGNDAMALNYFQIALTYDPENRDLCFLLVDKWKAAKKPDSALAVGLRCLELKGETTKPECQTLAEIYLRQGDVQNGLALYRRALELDEEDQDILFTLAGLYGSLKDVPRQTEMFEKLLPRVDFPPQMVEQQAGNYEALGKSDSVAALYRAAWKKTGNAVFGEKLILYGALLFGKGRYVEARNVFEKAAAWDGKNRLALYYLGMTLEKLRLRTESIEVMRDLAKQDTGNAIVLNYLGYMLIEEDRELDYAGALIDKALRLEPDNGAYLDSKGWWYYRKRNFVEARKYIEMAAERMPSDPTVLEHHALILEKLGETRAALEKWRRLLKLDPNHALAREKLN